MDQFDWMIWLLSATALGILVLGVVISVRLGSIDQSTARIAHVLEFEVLPRLAQLTATDPGTTGHEIRAIGQIVGKLPAKLDHLSRQLSTFEPATEFDTSRGPLKRVGIGDVISNVAKDLSQVKELLRKK